MGSSSKRGTSMDRAEGFLPPLPGALAEVGVLPCFTVFASAFRTLLMALNSFKSSWPRRLSSASSLLTWIL